MKRWLLAGVAGWALGLLTVAVVPDIVYEHRSVVLQGGASSLARSDDQLVLDAALRGGWRVARVDGVVYSLERPRLRFESIGARTPEQPTPAPPKP